MPRQPKLGRLGRTSCFIISIGSGCRSDPYAGSPNQAAMVGQTCASHASVAAVRAVLQWGNPSEKSLSSGRAQACGHCHEYASM